MRTDYPAWFAALALAGVPLAFGLVLSQGRAAASPDGARAAYAMAVGVEASTGGGTGTLVGRGGRAFVLTCQHVVEDEAAPDVADPKQVYYCSVRVWQDRRPYPACVLRVSTRHDLAVLEVLPDRGGRLPGVPGAPPVVAGPPAPGTELYNVGSPWGPGFGQVLLHGRVSRTYGPDGFGDGLTWGLASMGAVSGASGGPVLEARTGRLVGVLQSGYTNPTTKQPLPVAFYVPAARAAAWAKEAGVGFFFDAEAEVPPRASFWGPAEVLP